MQRKILLVEDETISAMVEAKMLEKHGFEVAIAYHGEKAVEIVDSDPEISLVLMDIDLGKGMDGTETAQRILESHNLPIVFLSSHTEPEIVEKTEGITSYGYIVKNSGEMVLIASLKMAFKLFEANNKIALSEEKHRTLFETMAPGVVYHDADGSIISANPASEKLLGLSFQQMKGKTPTDPRWKMITEEGKEVPGSEHPAMIALKEGEKVGPVTRGVFIPEKGEYVWLLVSATPLFRPGENKAYQVYATFDDITEQKKAEDNLRFALDSIEKKTKTGGSEDAGGSEEKFRNLAESVGAILWEYDISSDRWTYVAPQSKDLLGYDPSEWVNFQFWADKIHPEDKNWATDYCNRCTAQGQDHRFEYRFLTKDGGTVWLRDDVTVELNNKKPFKLRGFMVDITNRKQAEAELEQALKEKNFLMKELNHRVKNNLHMVSSLISLKEWDTGTDLSDLTHRIDAIRLVHEKLYQNNETDQVEVKEYLQDLLETIFSSFTNREVRIINNAINANIHINQSIYLGLVVNEIATNTIKYGFSTEAEPCFTVSLTENTEEQLYLLRLSNNGSPFPEEIDLDNPQTLGLQLISVFVKQLEGTVELQKKPHPMFTIQFPFV